MATPPKSKPAPLAPETQVGGYRIVRKVASGGFGVVSPMRMGASEVNIEPYPMLAPAGIALAAINFEVNVIAGRKPQCAASCAGKSGDEP